MTWAPIVTVVLLVAAMIAACVYFLRRTSTLARERIEIDVVERAKAFEEKSSLPAFESILPSDSDAEMLRKMRSLRTRMDGKPPS